MDDMPIEDEWLSQILGEGTRKHYTRTITYFKEFLKTSSAEDLINLRKRERNFETRIIQYFQWLQKERGVTSNSARAYVIGLQSFFNYAGCPVKLKNKLPKLHMKIESWKPTLEDLQKLYKFGDISVKAWLSLSRDIPARMGDMLMITNDQIESGEFTLLSKKESVVGKCYVSEDTRALFKQLETAKIVLPKSQRGIDKMVASACRIAGLPKRINQHLLRKFWISTAINIGIPEVIYKILSFKSVPQELLTYYLDRQDLKDSWNKVIETIPLENKSSGNGKVTSLEEDSKLFAEALWELVKPVVEKKRLEKLIQGGQKGAIGLLEMEAMPTDPKEGLKLFLKLRKGEENERGK